MATQAPSAHGGSLATSPATLGAHATAQRAPLAAQAPEGTGAQATIARKLGRPTNDRPQAWAPKQRANPRRPSPTLLAAAQAVATPMAPAPEGDSKHGRPSHVRPQATLAHCLAWACHSVARANIRSQHQGEGLACCTGEGRGVWGGGTLDGLGVGRGAGVKSARPFPPGGCHPPPPYSSP